MSPDPALEKRKTIIRKPRSCRSNKPVVTLKRPSSPPASRRRAAVCDWSVMTKAELIDSLATKAELPKPKAEEIVNGLFDDIVGALKSGDKVNISGFGTFS